MTSDEAMKGEVGFNHTGSGEMRTADEGRAEIGGSGRSGRFLGALLGLAVLATAVQGCGGAPADGAPAQEETSFRRVINVEVLPIESGRFDQRVRLTGTAEANLDVILSAEESGVVREVLVDKGSAVRQGQPLLRIDDTLLRAQVAEATARATLARETWERRQRLFETDGVGAELAYLEARYQAEQAEAALAMLNERLERTVVRAPIAGILENRTVEVGTLVAAGTPVARIVQVDPIKVTAGVPERYAGEVGVGDRAQVSFDVLGGRSFEGPIRFVGATVNAENRTFAIELVVPNPGAVIKPEMVARLEVVRGSLDQAVVIPQDAVVRVEDGFVAFVVEDGADGPVARVRPLVVGAGQRNQVLVESGIRPGDRLVVVGQNQVADGDYVRIVGTRSAVAMEAAR